MIRCIPKGICSWNFSLGGDDHHATLEFNWGNEQGNITADEMPFKVRKHGMLSGHWTLDRGEEQVATGKKNTAFTRTFEIQDSTDNLVLLAESALTRSFRVERSGDVIATICPDHAFTRRATIDTLAQDLDFTTLAFSFWLVALTWRRAQNNS
jgi:hypothetical protein